MPAPLNVDKEAVRVLVVAVGVREAARQCNLSENTVLAWANRGGWLQSVADARAIRDARQPESLQSPAISPADALSNSLEALGKRTRMGLASATATGADHVATLSGSEVVKQARNIKELAGTASILHGWTGEQPIVRINVMQRLDGEKQVEGKVIDI